MMDSVCIWVHCDSVSRLTVLNCVAKQSRAHDTTMCYIHERSILIDHSPKAYCEKLPYEKPRITKTTYNH